MAKSWKFKGGVLFGILVIVIPLLYELWDAGVLPLPFESDKVEWHGIKTLSCGGNQELELKGTKAYNKDKLFPAMISVGGNCQLRIIGATITGHKVLSIGGSGKVLIEGSTLDAEDTAVYLGGNGQVSIVSSTIKGKKAALYVAANARVTLDEQSKIEGRVSGRKKNIVKKAAETVQ